MKGVALLQTLSGNRTWSIPPERYENVLLSYFSETAEAILTAADDPERELLALEHAVVDLLIDEHARQLIEVRGFQAEPGTAGRYSACRITFFFESPAS
jgi:hypothetical protein